MDKIDETLASQATRRKIVTTGVKMAYVAPVVAASFKLSAGGAAAISFVECKFGEDCVSAVCGGDSGCGCNRTPEGDNFCIQHDLCGPVCESSKDCADGLRCVRSCCSNWTCQSACQSRAVGAGVAADGPRTDGQ